MFDKFIANLNLGSSFIVDMVIVLILVIACCATMIYFFHKAPAIYVVVGILFVYTIFAILGFSLVANLLALLFIVIATIFILANISEFRKFFVKAQEKSKKASAKYDREALYRVIDDTVHSLSRTKTGAIMTFERSTNLDDVMKNGTVINAPVTQELIETIFYEGTRLHDGAIVIRDNMIVAASVYYTPTTRALTGKYGSRHRAAFGISEISDSVTGVVSEETGRVAIAQNGSLEPIHLDAFLREFTDKMNEHI